MSGGNLGSARGSITLNVSSLRRAAQTVTTTFQQIGAAFQQLASASAADAARINQSFAAVAAAPARITQAATPLRQLTREFTTAASSAQQSAARVAQSVGQIGQAGQRAQAGEAGVRRFDAALNQVGATAGRVDAQLQPVSQRFQQIGASLAGTGATLSAAVTAPLLGIAGSALRMSIDFQTGMNVLAASSDEAAARMDELRARAIELGADVTLPGTSAADAGEAMLELVKAGISVTDTMAAAQGVLQLSAAAQVDNATAAQITAAALNTFGLSGAEALSVVDQLAAGANASSANIIDMSYGLTQAGFAFASMVNPGYSAQQAVLDLNTAVAALSKNGLSGSDGATALKNAIIKLQAPTEAGAKTLARLGIAVFDANGQMLPFQQILANLERGLAGLSQQERNVALNSIFLSDGMKAIIPLLGIGTAGFAELQGQVSQEGAAARLAAAQTQGLGGALQGLQSTLETVGLALTEPLLGPLESLVRGFTDLVDQVLTIDPAIRNAALAFLAVAAAAGPLLLLLGGLASAFGFLVGPIGVLVGIVAALAAAFASGAVQLSIFAPILEQLQRIGSLVGQALTQVIGQAASWGSGLIEAYAGGIAAAVGAVADALGAIADTISYWLTPGSPPPLLPDLDTWGTGAAQAWLDGWSKADLDALSDLGSQVSDVIRSFGAGAGASDQTILDSVIGTDAAIRAAIEQVRESGSVSEDTFATIRASAGGAGEAAERLARAYIATLQASRQLQAAQEGQRAANAEVVRAQADLARALATGNPQLIAERRAALAAAVAKRREARERVTAAQTAETAAKDQLSQQQALIEAQQRQNDLLVEQRRLQEQASKGGGGGGGGGRKGKSEEELAAERAKKAEEAYKDSVATTGELLDRRRAELAGLTEGSAEYYQTLQEIARLEKQQEREQQAAAAEAQREQDAVTRAQRAYEDSVSSTAEKLARRREELAGLTVGSAEYYDKLREIGQLEEQQRREAEAAAKEAAKTAAGGRAGGGGGGGVKLPTGAGAGGPLGELITQAGQAAKAVDDAMVKITKAIDYPRRAVQRLGADVRGVPATFASAVPNIISSLLGAIPGIIATGGQWVIALGSSLITALPGILATVGRFVGGVLDGIGAGVPGIVAAAARWAAAFVTWAITALPILLASLQILAGRLVTWIQQRVPVLATTLRLWAQAFITWLTLAGPGLLTGLAGIVGQLFGLLATVVGGIATAVAPWVGAFLSWLGEALPGLIVEMGALRARVIEQIGAALPGIITTLGGWATAFVQWVVEAAPGLLGAIGTTVGQLLDAVGGALPGIVGALATWGAALIEWVIAALPGLFANLLTLISQLMGWIIARSPGILAQLGQWALAFVSWVLPAAADLIIALGVMFGQLLAFIIDNTPGIISTILQWAAAFYGWVATEAIPKVLEELLKFVGRITGFIDEQVAGIVSKAMAIGTAITDGIRNGITNGWEALKRFVRDKANELLNSAKSALGIQSPSSRFRDEFGQEIPAGAELGVRRGIPAVVDAVQRMAEAAASVRVQIPPVDTRQFAAAGAALSAAAQAVPVVDTRRLAEAATAAQVPGRQTQPSGVNVQGDIVLQIPGAPINNAVDARRMGRELAQEFLYQIKRTG